MEECEEGKCVDGYGAPPDELGARCPEGGPKCEAEEEDGEYEIPYFLSNPKLLCDGGDRRRGCGTGESTIRRQSLLVMLDGSHGAEGHVHG